MPKTASPAALKTAQEVQKDLQAQKDIGVRISAKAIAYPIANAAKVHDLYENGMSIEEVADHVRSIAG